jgi:hypothetical protein
MTYAHCPYCGLTRADDSRSLLAGHCPRCLAHGERIEMLEGRWSGSAAAEFAIELANAVQSLGADPRS